MTRYATVWSDVWDDDRFLKCSNDAKVLYMFLISNHATNLIGYYQAPRNLAQASLSFGTEEFDTILNEIADAGLIAISSDRKYVLIKGYLKFNKINGDSQFKKLKVELEHIERNSLDSTFVSEINRFCFHESNRIHTIMRNEAVGWEYNGNQRCGEYGIQRAYVRKSEGGMYPIGEGSDSF